MTETLVEYGRAVKEEALSLSEQARSLEIVTKEDFELAGEFGLSLARVRKELEKYWEKSVGDAKQSYDTQKALRDADLYPVEEAEKYNSKNRQAWKMEQDRIERGKQVEKEAREKAEKERQQQKLLEKAAEMEKLNPKKAEILLEKAAMVIEKPVFAERAVEKTTKMKSGGSITWITDIKVVVVDVKEACTAVANGFLPIICIEFKNLKQVAKMNGWRGEKYGLKITETQRESKRT